MNDFFLRFDLPKTNFSINHFHQLTFLGSCFSDEISTYASLSGFQVLSNPYGTIYNPLSIAKNINNAFQDNPEFSMLQRDNLFYSWDASTKINATGESELRNLVTNKNCGLRERLLNPGYLFVTFGTAYIYRLKNEEIYVANCHKQPAHFFEKELSSVDTIVAEWKSLLKRLQSENPGLKVVFTVSPVRHIRDGIIENNRSKARLIQIIEELTLMKNVEYFPSYEIVMDELRDYRFFKGDRIHPSDEAIEYIWKRFSDLYFDTETKANAEDFVKVRKRLMHRSDKRVPLDFNTQKMMKDLENRFPWTSWKL